MSTPPFARAWALAACLWPAVASAAPLTADDVVRYALDHHPDVVAAAGAVDVTVAERREAAVFLANPQLDGSLAVVGDRVEASALQPLSLTGEGWHARRAAALGREAAEARLRRTEYLVAAGARNAWVRAVLAERRAGIAEEALLLAGQLRAATDRREEVGEGSALESRLARLDEARAIGEALAARRDVAAARTALAGLAPAIAGAELADDLDLPRPSMPAAERSDVVAARAKADAARAAVRRQAAGGFPLVGVGASLEQDEGQLTAGPAVALQLPLWNRNQAGVAAARRDLAVAQADAARAEAVASAEREASSTLAARAVEDLERLGDPTGDARDALAAIGSAFERGELDVSTAVLLRREVLEGWPSAVDAEQIAAELTLFHLLSTEDPSLLEVRRPRSRRPGRGADVHARADDARVDPRSPGQLRLARVRARAASRSALRPVGNGCTWPPAQRRSGRGRSLDRDRSCSPPRVKWAPAALRRRARFRVPGDGCG